MPDYQITNPQELIGAVKLCGQRFNDTQMWWRGHALMEPWTLKPKVFRTAEYELAETSMIGRFVSKARTRHPNCPERSDAAAWLFLMQHYGLPTRILDWTESVLVAAYFAIRDEGKFDQDGAIWALAPACLNEKQNGNRILLGTNSPPVDSLIKEAFAPSDQRAEGPIVAINAHEVDVRMMVQRSAFTVHGTRTALEESPDNDCFLQRFSVPATAKPGLKAILKAYGYTESNLFPDLEHLTKEIRSLRFELRPEQPVPDPE